MEFVEGVPLGAADGARQRLDVAIQIADGLAADDAAGIIHRDFKPDNILITERGASSCYLSVGLFRAAADRTQAEAAK